MQSRSSYMVRRRRGLCWHSRREGIMNLPTVSRGAPNRIDRLAWTKKLAQSHPSFCRASFVSACAYTQTHAYKHIPRTPAIHLGRMYKVGTWTYNSLCVRRSRHSGVGQRRIYDWGVSFTKRDVQLYIYSYTICIFWFWNVAACISETRFGTVWLWSSLWSDWMDCVCICVCVWKKVFRVRLWIRNMSQGHVESAMGAEWVVRDDAYTT